METRDAGRTDLRLDIWCVKQENSSVIERTPVRYGVSEPCTAKAGGKSVVCMIVVKCSLDESCASFYCKAVSSYTVCLQ